MRDQRAHAGNRAPEARPLLSSVHAASCGRAFLCPFSCLSPYPQGPTTSNGAQGITTGNVTRTWMPRDRETGISPRARPLQSAILRRGSWKRGLQDLDELPVNLSTMMNSTVGIAIVRRRCFQKNRKNTARMQNRQASADVVRMLCGCLNPNIRTTSARVRATSVQGRERGDGRIPSSSPRVPGRSLGRPKLRRADISRRKPRSRSLGPGLHLLRQE